MKRYNIIFLTLLIFLPLALSAQMEMIRDTVYFENYGKRIMVIQTTNRQYYNDSLCVWEVAYPEIYNMANRIRESSVNLMFSREVSFGDCDDKVCDRTTMYFPLLNRYWDKVVATSIRNDLLSYYVLEGSCPAYTKVCFVQTRHHIYDLKFGSEIEPGTLFKKDAATIQKLDSLILHKLDFVPEDMEAVRYERQFYFDKNKLMVFFDNYTLGKKETYSLELSYADVKGLLSPSGPLPVFFEQKNAFGK